ncbi:MAG: nucleotidyltransferase substrate binding protein [Proteobacteria bacterium]|nr:nucleotidyltransferase substrate binding protein [Pseudomonadota bacterium]
MVANDILWKQRLQNFKHALSQFDMAIQFGRQRPLNDLEKQGLIQAFEFTHELAWNVMKDYFEYQGTISITGSRDATREAFQKGLIQEGERWMEMIKSRNQTAHTYNKAIAEEIVNKIQNEYAVLFSAFFEKMTEISKR